MSNSHKNYLRPIDQKEQSNLPHVSKAPVDKTVKFPDYPIYVIDKEHAPDKILCEVNTAILDEPLLPFEECIVTITPKANKKIRQLISVYVPMEVNKINHNLIFTLIGFTEKNKSFQIYFKNNNDFAYDLKICYHVVF